MGFKDLFSTASDDYARFRPRYPAALFDWLADQAPARALAVDVKRRKLVHGYLEPGGGDRLPAPLLLGGRARGNREVEASPPDT